MPQSPLGLHADQRVNLHSRSEVPHLSESLEAEKSANNTSETTVSGEELHVVFIPDGKLYLQKLLTRSIYRRSLIIMNPNIYAVAFKFRTTHPELYCVCPSASVVEAGKNIHVIVESAPRLEEPLLNKRCKHKLLVEVTAIATEQGDRETKDFIKSARKSGRTEFYKIRVAYMAAGDLMPQEFRIQNDPGIRFPVPGSKAEFQSLVRVKKDAAGAFGLANGRRMHIYCRPSAGDALCFQRPLTRPISRSLVITNRNSYKVGYELKTTAPKLYYTRPNSGIVEPGQNVNVTIEKIPLAKEPPLDEKCKDQFLLDITPVITEQDVLSINGISQGPKKQIEHFRFGVKYLPAEGLPQEELAEYAAGMAHFIPEQLFSIYPETALCFRKPLRNPINSTEYMGITNIYTRPIAFQIFITSRNTAMYAVHPVSGRIESGGYLKIQGARRSVFWVYSSTVDEEPEMLAFIVVCQPITEQPPLKEERPGMFCVQCTVINLDQENLSLNDIWEVTKSNKQPIFHQELRILFISSRNLTPEEEAITAQQGIFDRLMKEDAEQFVKASGMNRLGHFEANVEESWAAAPEKLSKVQEASIQEWLLSIPKQPELVLPTAAV